MYFYQWKFQKLIKFLRFSSCCEEIDDGPIDKKAKQMEICLRIQSHFHCNCFLSRKTEVSDSTETGGSKEKEQTENTSDLVNIQISGSKSCICLVLSDSNFFRVVMQKNIWWMLAFITIIFFLLYVEDAVNIQIWDLLETMKSWWMWIWVKTRPCGGQGHITYRTAR